MLIYARILASQKPIIIKSFLKRLKCLNERHVNTGVCNQNLLLVREMSKTIFVKQRQIGTDYYLCCMIHSTLTQNSLQENITQA